MAGTVAWVSDTDRKAKHTKGCMFSFGWMTVPENAPNSGFNVFEPAYSMASISLLRPEHGAQMRLHNTRNLMRDDLHTGWIVVPKGIQRTAKLFDSNTALESI
ncbi:hypothetical protein N7540_000040 [Penicillium herquei]|nr:hypothetical protein N7540_000040 [Penicillium herquei]